MRSDDLNMSWAKSISDMSVAENQQYYRQYQQASISPAVEDDKHTEKIIPGKSSKDTFPCMPFDSETINVHICLMLCVVPPDRVKVLYSMG